MWIVLLIVTVVLQLIVGQLLGFIGAMIFSFGSGSELLVIPLGNTLGIWGIGALMALLRKRSATHALALRFVGTLLGAAIGTGLILLTPATGFVQLLYPLLSALIGYYFLPMILQKKDVSL